MSKKQKSQAKNFLNQNPLESLGGIMQGVGDTLTTDLAGAGVGDLFEQMLGIEAKKPEKRSGDLAEGEALDLKKAREAQIEPGIDYRREIVHAERRITQETSRTTQVRIEEILIEIKNLVSSSQELETQFKDVAVEAPIANPGKYHEGFFDLMLTFIRQAKIKIQDSTAWLTAMHSKKDKRYWAQFKKYGTTFGLSNERTVATQAG